MKKLLEKLVEFTGSSKNLAYKIIDECMTYNDEEADKLAALIRKWKQYKKIPKKWENCIKEVAEKLGIQNLDEEDKKLLKCVFINFLKDIKIFYYEDKNFDKEKFLIFLIFMLVFDKEFISESIEKEWGSLIELEENK